MESRGVRGLGCFHEPVVAQALQACETSLRQGYGGPPKLQRRRKPRAILAAKGNHENTKTRRRTKEVVFFVASCFRGCIRIVKNAPTSLAQIADSIGVPVARRHIFLCCDQTNPKCCEKERGLAAWDFLKRRLKELGLSEQGGVLRSKVNCFRICEGGPIAVVYPEGAWYGQCDPPVLDRIIQEHLVGGRIVDEYLIAQHRLD